MRFPFTKQVLDSVMIDGAEYEVVSANLFSSMSPCLFCDMKAKNANECLHREMCFGHTNKYAKSILFLRNV